MDETSERGIRTLTEARALRALAHPLRARLLDALKVDGPSTVSALASRTSQAVGSASHHLKVLAEADLVHEAPELARDGRERWWRLAGRGTSWSTSDLMGDPAAMAAADEAAALLLRRQVERVQEYRANAEALPQWADAAFTTQFWLRLTPTELSELGVEFRALLQRWSERPSLEDELDPNAPSEREPVLIFAHAFPTQP